MTAAAPKQMHLAAHFPGADGTTVRTDPFRGRTDFSSFEHLARTAERGLFDFLLLADGPWPGGPDGPVPGQDVAGRPESLTMLAALAGVTERLGLAATADATFNEPYELARRLATLDHLSAGRAAWNVVSSRDALAGENFRRGAGPDGAGLLRGPGFTRTGGTPFTRAAEFVATARELWDSWTPDGVPRPFAHHGRHFSVGGEFTVPRSPQGHPVVIQSADSRRGRESAAAAADIVLTRLGTPDAARSFYADVKGRLAKYGREPDELKVMPGVHVVLGDSDAEARERADAIRPGGIPPQHAAPARGGGLPARRTLIGATGRQPLAGSPPAVAARLAEYVAAGAADGFVLVPHPAIGGLDEFIDRVVPLLQERGVFRCAYTGSTLRSHLGLAEPVWKG
ncbi:LLM class flavin-dependent oxidoreductase [Streptomyces sp. NBC_00876]|uniref:LLM class flavin-dependent oxidoreductase n=1 Tax=Streptomyces sp. NBC_00876 TaxID=2975853 RepID=UPI00386E49F4|nr:LLM class flavin-dependent oxidoreductase [Streptomyces sp. NBC_00876]